jgi:Fe2+ transport system protein FeoA
MMTRLREIGLGEEQVVKMVSSQSMVVCQVCNARLAIGAALAETILVEPIVLAKAA